MPGLPGGRRYPGEQPAGEVDTYDLTGLVAGEAATLSFERATGDDVRVSVARQQAESERCVIRGDLGVRGGTDLRPQEHFVSQPATIRVDGERHHIVLLIPDNLPSPRLVIEERLRVPVDHAQVSLEGPTDDCLVAGDPVRAGVGL